MRGARGWGGRQLLEGRQERQWQKWRSLQLNLRWMSACECVKTSADVAVRTSFNSGFSPAHHHNTALRWQSGTTGGGRRSWRAAVVVTMMTTMTMVHHDFVGRDDRHRTFQFQRASCTLLGCG